jgi:hypothetical protein
MNNANNSPIFVIGTGRSGLTPLMDLIAYHRAFAWPSQYNARWPNIHQLSTLSRLVEIAPLSSRLKFASYIIPTHAESYELWNDCFPGFKEPFRDLVVDDVTPYVKSRFQNTVDDILKYQGKTRFIAEYSGWSRIEFMKCIFPKAKFIHIVRDGRGVAHSLTNVQWWKGWLGVYNWRWGVPDQDLLEKLKKYDYSFLALGAIHWKILINNILEKSDLLPEEDLLVVRYEDLVKDPVGETDRCLEFCGVDKNCPKFKKHLATVKIVNANENKFRIPSWKENLNQKQVDMLNDLLEEELTQLNYL